MFFDIPHICLKITSNKKSIDLISIQAWISLWIYSLMILWKIGREDFDIKSKEKKREINSKYNPKEVNIRFTAWDRDIRSIVSITRLKHNPFIYTLYHTNNKLREWM